MNEQQDKLLSIISGYKINEDDAACLLALLHRTGPARDQEIERLRSTLEAARELHNSLAPLVDEVSELWGTALLTGCKSTASNAEEAQAMHERIVAAMERIAQIEAVQKGGEE